MLYTNRFQLLTYFILLFFPMIAFGEIIYSTYLGGSWDSPSTWEGGVVPSETTEKVEIVLGSSVQVPAGTVISSVLVNKGEVEFESGGARVVLLQDFYNEGTTVYSFDLRADLYNAVSGVIPTNSTVYLFENTATGVNKIVNEGVIVRDVIIQEEAVEFFDQQVFNFGLQGGGREVVLSANTTFQSDVRNVLFSTKDNQEFSVTFEGSDVYDVRGTPFVNAIFTKWHLDDRVFPEEEVNFKSITVGPDANLEIDGKSIINSEIFNKGRMRFSTNVSDRAVVNKDIHNEGQIDYSSFHLKANLYNLPTGEITNRSNIFLYKNISTGINTISNQGNLLGSVLLQEDGILFSPQQVFDFSFDGGSYDLLINSDITFLDNVRKVNFVSQDGERHLVTFKDNTVSGISGGDIIDIAIDAFIDIDTFFENKVSDFRTILVKPGARFVVDSEVVLNSIVLNRGEITFESGGAISPILNKDLYNEGTVSSSRIRMHADIYNSPTGVFSSNSTISLYKNVEKGMNKIVNNGSILKSISLGQEDVEFVPNQDFNFGIFGNGKRVVVSSDILFKEAITNTIFTSKNNSHFYLKFTKNSSSIGGGENLSLIIDGYVASQSFFKDDESRFENIIVEPTARFVLGGRLTAYSDIINKGKLQAESLYGDTPSTRGVLYNEGQVSGSTLKVYGDIFNSPAGLIENTIHFYRNNISGLSHIINEGAWSKTVSVIGEGVEFVPQQRFNFAISGAHQNILLSADTEFEEAVTNIGFASSNNSEINIKMSNGAVSKISGSEDINLIFDGSFQRSYIFNNGVSNFKTISILPNSSVNMYGHLVLNSEIINKGEIIFSSVSFGDLLQNPVFTNHFSNDGEIVGATYFKDKDMSPFTYLLTGQESLSSAQQTELAGKAPVAYSEDLATTLRDTETLSFVHQGGSVVKLNHEVLVPTFSQTPAESYSENAPVLRDFIENENIETYVAPDSDVEAPVITLLGGALAEIPFSRTYNELGFQATDDSDGNLTSQVVVSGSVNTVVSGDYLLTYTVSDSSGNKTSVVRVVRVWPEVKGSSSKRSSRKRSSESRKQYKKIQSSLSQKKEDLDVSLQSPSNAPEDLRKRVEDMLRQIKFLQTQENESDSDLEKEEERSAYLLESLCIGIQSNVNPIQRGQAENKKSQVQLVQMFLNTYGYNVGRPDGFFGKNTEAMLQDFQRDNSLIADGVLGSSTVSFIDKKCENIVQRAEWEGGDGVEEEEVILSPIVLQLQEEREEKKQETQQDLQRSDRTIDHIGQVANQDTGDIFTNFSKQFAAIPLKVGGNLFKGGEWAGNKASEAWTGVKQQVVSIPIDEEKEFYLEIYQGTAEISAADPKKETVIIVHGFLSNTEVDWVQEIAGYVNDGSSQILLLDWSDVTDNLNIKSDARKIAEVSQKLSQNLREWGIDPNTTTIIGHSLGSILGATLSTDLGGVKKLVVLDPASVGEYQISDTSDYFASFADTAQKTQCFVGSASLLGSESLTKTCDEKIYIDFPFKEGEHSGVHKIYRDILKSNTLYDNILSLKNSQRISEGLININGDLPLQESQLDYLRTEFEDSEVVYGSEIDNELECEKEECTLYGWLGDDTYYVDDEVHNFRIGDFREKQGGGSFVENDDKIIIDKDYDRISFGSDSKNVSNTVLFVHFNGYKDTKKVTLKGVNKEIVGNWLDASLVNMKASEELLKKTPIEIR